MQIPMAKSPSICCTKSSRSPASLAPRWTSSGIFARVKHGCYEGGQVEAMTTGWFGRVPPRRNGNLEIGLWWLSLIIIIDDRWWQHTDHDLDILNWLGGFGFGATRGYPNDFGNLHSDELTQAYPAPFLKIAWINQAESKKQGTWLLSHQILHNVWQNWYWTNRCGTIWTIYDNILWSHSHSSSRTVQYIYIYIHRCCDVILIRLEL